MTDPASESHTERETMDKKALNEIRIVLAEDHIIVRQGFVALLGLEENLTVCAEAENTAETLAALEEHDPDLLLMDLGLKGEDGLELIKRAKSLHPKLPILVISAQDEQIYAERVLRAGAMGYVMKNLAADQLIEAIQSVVSGEIYISNAMNARLLQRFIGGKRDEGDSPVDQLTDRELHVFQLIGSGMPTRDIAEELGISRKTVDTYREHIKNKLGLKDGAALVQRATTWVQSQ